MDGWMDGWMDREIDRWKAGGCYDYITGGIDCVVGKEGYVWAATNR